MAAQSHGPTTVEGVLRQLDRSSKDFHSLSADVERTKVTVVVNDKSVEDGTLLVRGLTTDAIGDIAFEQGIRVHELSVLRASLEEAFMELTADSVEYHAGVPDVPASIASGV